jgi:FliI/YscN family ATPase
VPVGDGLLGRILDGLGQPIDGGAAILPERLEPVTRESPHPYHRQRIRIQLPVGVKAIDAMLPCGQGQRMGIFAAAGGGKSTLMGMIARYSEADVKVIVLIGERGREVREFIEDNLQDGLRTSVVVVATADQPSVVRMKSAYIGTTIAEYFRDQGKKVILMMDSVTRFARALREIGLARGEPPARYGFPPSVFAELPRLFERCGNSEESGSLTGFYTVLVEGDDFNEPVADETKSLLDGHILLSPKTPYYPRIQMLASESRVRSTLELPPEVRTAHRRVYDFMQRYQQKEQALEFGALEKDEASGLRAGIGAVRDFLKQDEQARFGIAVTRAEFVKLSQQIEPALK